MAKTAKTLTFPPAPTTAADVRLHGHLSCWAADISPHDEIDFPFHLSLRRLSTFQLWHRMALYKVCELAHENVCARGLLGGSGSVGTCKSRSATLPCVPHRLGFPPLAPFNPSLFSFLNRHFFFAARFSLSLSLLGLVSMAHQHRLLLTYLPVYGVSFFYTFSKEMEFNHFKPLARKVST